MSEITKVYPSCCTSAFCGRTECKDCPRLPILEEFKKWVKETGAVCCDRIWCPNVYFIPYEFDALSIEAQKTACTSIREWLSNAPKAGTDAEIIAWARQQHIKFKANGQVTVQFD